MSHVDKTYIHRKRDTEIHTYMNHQKYDFIIQGTWGSQENYNYCHSSCVNFKEKKESKK